MRRVIAWLGHAPGLWLVYREPLPRALRTPNAIAVALTLVAIGVGVAIAGALAGVLAWLAGHVAWGSYLAWKLPPRASEARKMREPRENAPAA